MKDVIQILDTSMKHIHAFENPEAAGGDMSSRDPGRDDNEGEHICCVKELTEGSRSVTEESENCDIEVTPLDEERQEERVRRGDVST